MYFQCSLLVVLLAVAHAGFVAQHPIGVVPLHKLSLEVPHKYWSPSHKISIAAQPMTMPAAEPKLPVEVFDPKMVMTAPVSTMTMSATPMRAEVAPKMTVAAPAKAVMYAAAAPKLSVASMPAIAMPSNLKIMLRTPPAMSYGLAKIYAPTASKLTMEGHHEAEEESKAMPYSYSYEVSDDTTGDHKSVQESSDGEGNVSGSYSMLEADGSTRTVEYTADDVHGFQATVHKVPSKHPMQMVVKEHPPLMMVHHEPMAVVKVMSMKDKGVAEDIGMMVMKHH